MPVGEVFEVPSFLNHQVVRIGLFIGLIIQFITIRQRYYYSTLQQNKD